MLHHFLKCILPSTSTHYLKTKGWYLYYKYNMHCLKKKQYFKVVVFFWSAFTDFPIWFRLHVKTVT